MIYFAAFLLLSAWIDFEHLADNDFIESHVSRWLLRGVFMLGVSNSFLELAAMVLLWMACFDSVLNVFRGKGFNYLGNTAKWDIFFNKRKNLYITIKILAVVVGIGLIIIE